MPFLTCHAHIRIHIHIHTHTHTYTYTYTYAVNPKYTNQHKLDSSNIYYVVQVLEGAADTIRNMVSMFTFEGGGGVKVTADMVEKYDKMGFSCFSTSRAGLIKWSSGCMSTEKYGAKRDKGNVFCLSRTRAPLLTLAFDALSFPGMMAKLRADQGHPDSDLVEGEVGTGNEGEEGKVKAGGAAVEAAGNGAVEIDVSESFVHWKPFCKNWPSCVLDL